METELWIHNVRHHPVVVGAIPRNAVRALDVGCGQGALARRLRAVVPEVAAIDLDPTSIDLARGRCSERASTTCSATS
ncbi:methyltransferase domain-containing protein [Pseudonocardia saturnea]